MVMVSFFRFLLNVFFTMLLKLHTNYGGVRNFLVRLEKMEGNLGIASRIVCHLTDDNFQNRFVSKSYDAPATSKTNPGPPIARNNDSWTC